MYQEDRPNITTGSTHIKVEGYSDEGGWHRAVMTAKHLYEKGFWNGVETITIHNPYDAHYKMMCGWRDPLREGTDYSFPDRQYQVIATFIQPVEQDIITDDTPDDTEVDYITEGEAYEALSIMYSEAVDTLDEFRKLLRRAADIIDLEGISEELVAEIHLALSK